MLVGMQTEFDIVQKSNKLEHLLDESFGKVTLSDLDHVACAHRDESVIDFYTNTFGLVNFWEAGAAQIKSANASLEAKVYTNENNNVKMTFLTSQNQKNKISQINEFLH